MDNNVTIQDEQQVIKALLVDDDIHIHKLARSYFAQKQFKFLHAEDAEMGIQMAHTELPDVIICDIGLPHQDGFELIRQVHQHPLMSAIPIILISGEDQKPNLLRAGQTGADAFLPKPFLMSELEKVISARVRRLDMISSKYDSTLSLLRTNIAYALPHELRTPLTYILGYADMLQEHGIEVDDNFVAKSSRSILNGAKRLERVIENYLVFTQLQLIRYDVEKRIALRNHVTQTQHNIMWRATTTAMEYGREDDLKLDLSDGKICMSEENLQKIIHEFVDNALKFSDKGTSISVKSGCIGSNFVIIVQDHGRGMTEEQIERIGAYIQFDREHHEQQGVGLGLAIATQLIYLHKGKLLIESSPEEGTLVRVTLPV